MNISEIIDFLCHEDTYWSSRGHKCIEIPFDISAEDYIQYADEDFKGKDTHSLVNALSNAKRALDCRIDALLIAFGVYEKAKKDKWGVPRKIEEITEYGIIAPRVLKKINSVRNLVEHEFIKPDVEQVSDFIDIASLFLASTEKYIYDFPDDAELENHAIEDYWLRFYVNFDNNMIFIRIIHKDKDNEEIELNMKDKECIKILKEYLKNVTCYK